MNEWLKKIRFNPIKPLLRSKDKALVMFVKKDILGERVSIESLWEEKAAQKILKKQRAYGSWKYTTKIQNHNLQKYYDQYETYKQLAALVEQYGFNKKHPAIAKTATYFFNKQSKDGDFRGIYGKQYSPNYSAAITELLIKAGYSNNPHINKVFKWLLNLKQEDGGWALPYRTRGFGNDVFYSNKKTIKPDKKKISSYMVTGVVLRAFAAHKKYKRTQPAKHAGKILMSYIFERDNYADRVSKDYWLRFSFPFCYTDLISALNSLSLMNFSPEEENIKKALQWFRKGQQKNGLWQFRITRGKNKHLLNMWLSLAVCKIFKRFFG